MESTQYHESEHSPLTYAGSTLRTEHSSALAEAYSLQDLVRLQIPGYPSTISGLNRLFQRLGVKFVSRPGRGGGRLYLFSSLPQEFQNALTQQYKVEASQQLTVADFRNLPEHIAPISLPLESGVSYKRLNSTSEKAQVRMDTRIAILQSFKDFHSKNPSRQLDAEVRFAQLYNSRQFLIEVPGGYSAHDIHPTLSRKQIATWRSQQKSEGTARLKGNYGPREGKTKISLNSEIQNFIITALYRFPHIQATHLMKALETRYEDAINFSLRTLQNWLKRWKEENKGLFSAFVSPNEWKSKFMVAFGSYSQGLKRNDRVEMDDSPFDLILADGKRYKLVAAIEVATRARRLELRETNNFEVVASVLRFCIVTWGKMLVLVTDRGAPFVSAEVKRCCKDININHHICKPNSPWEKPYAESAIRGTMHSLLELSPEYIGHSVQERQQIQSRLRGFDREPIKEMHVGRNRKEMQALLDSLNAIYMETPQKALEGKSPNQKLLESQEEAIYVVDERTLDVLLTRVPGNSSKRIVQKRGIQIGEDWFIATELEKYVNDSVHIRVDSDPEKVYVFDGDSQRICIAQKATVPTTDRPKIARTARKKQMKNLQSQLSTYKQLAESLKLETVLQEIVKFDLQKIQQEMLQSGQNVYESPIMKALSELMDAQSPEQIQESLSPEELEAARMLLNAAEEAQFSIQPEVSDAFKKLRQVVSLWQKGKSITDISQQDVDQVKALLDSSCGESFLAVLISSKGKVQEFFNWLDNTNDEKVEEAQILDRAKLLDKVFYQWGQAVDTTAIEKQEVLDYLTTRTGQGRLFALEFDWHKRQSFENWLAEIKLEEKFPQDMDEIERTSLTQ
jgi:putative transposase